MTDHADNHAHDEPHAVPLGTLAGVFGILMVLTAATVGAWMIDLGPLNIPLAIGIAVVKASFVALYFMHLRWDSPFNAAILVFSMVFVSLFIIFSLVDTSEYRTNIEEAGPTQFETKSLETLREDADGP